MSSRDLVEKRNVHLEGKEHRQERRRWTSTFICLQKCPDVVGGLERQLVAPKQVVSVARVCKGLDCNSQVTCESGCDHFQ